MQNVNLFPNMVIQMVAIGEESGALDSMLSKVADFFEQEVDDAVEAMSSLMEPVIMVVLGTLIGGMVVAMYLPNIQDSARWFDASSKPWAALAALGRFDRSLRRQLPQRGHSSPAQNDGAGMAGEQCAPNFGAKRC
jgi:hypothetical protein